LYFQVDIQLASIAQRYASDLTDSIMSVLSGFSPLVCLVTHWTTTIHIIYWKFKIEIEVEISS